MLRTSIVLSTTLFIAGCGSGTKGDPGPQGSPGPTGLIGPTGVLGATGPAGMDGVTGATGPTGVDATSDTTPPPAPTSIWIDQRGPKHFLNWKLPAAATPKIAFINIYRSTFPINKATDLVEQVSGANTSAEIELAADSGGQEFQVSAVSVAGIEGDLSPLWIQYTHTRLALVAKDGPTGFEFLWSIPVYAGPGVVAATKIETASGSPVNRVRFSPDAGRVAFIGGISNFGDLWVRSSFAGTGTALRMNPTAMDADHAVNDFAWSPDGKYMWFTVRAESTDAQELWLVDTVAGSMSAAKVADLPVRLQGENAAKGEPQGPTFTPDGEKLLYFDTQAASPTRCELFSLPAALPLVAPTSLSGTIASTGGAGTLFGTMFGLVSPDSRTMALVNVVPNDPAATNHTIKSHDVWMVPLVSVNLPIRVGVLGNFIDGKQATGSWSWDAQNFVFGSDLSPSPSPTGRTTDEIRMATATGGFSRTVLDPSYFDANVAVPDFSTLGILDFLPDNEHVVASFATTVGVFHSGGGGFQSLVSAATLGVLVSPNGQYVARDAGSNKLAMYSLESGTASTRGGMKAPGSNDAPFHWFPDGDRLLALDSDNNIVIVHAGVAGADLNLLPIWNTTSSVAPSELDISPLGYRVIHASANQ